MRKAQKEQAKGFLEVLAQVHDEIIRCMKKNLISEAMELLGQCQEGAIQLGNLIEETEGEDFVTIGMLEEYCEYIYQLHEALHGKIVQLAEQTAVTNPTVSSSVRV